jgi:hypothetical protein
MSSSGRGSLRALRVAGPAVVVLLAACGGSSPGAGVASRDTATVAAAGTPEFADATDPRWASIRRVFRGEGEAREGYFRVNFPRTDLRVRIGDVTLEPEFELTSYFGFAPGPGGDVTGMGEVILRQEEVNRALAEAERQGVRVTALHNHMLDEQPTMYWIHWFGTGAGAALARGVAAAIGATNSVPRSEAESG